MVPFEGCFDQPDWRQEKLLTCLVEMSWLLIDKGEKVMKQQTIVI